MEKLGTALGVISASFVLIFIATIMGTVLGAMSGWTAGLVFGETILGFISQLGIKNIAMWELGASLGFIGGYFRSIATKK